MGNCSPNRANICSEAATDSRLPAIVSTENTLEISVNATAQKRIADEIEIIEKKIIELRQICEITSDIEILRE
ncbi:2498_t:CDS:2, partial [Dentiscutata erythropus]